MDNTETAQPDSSRQTAAPEDNQASGGTERSTGAGEVLQRYLKAQATQISRIVASLNQYRQDVQKLEVSLIARIGDVDDDRRHAATRLQRTLQTQREELDERLKRHGSLMAVLLLLFSLMVAGTLVFFLFKLNATQESLETQMGDLRRTLEQIDASSRSEPDPETRVQLDRLSAALAGISKSIERLNEETTKPPLDLDLDLRLEPEPRPRPVVATPPASMPQPAPAPEPESMPEPEPTPSPEMASEPTPAPLPDSEPESESESESAPTPTPDISTELASSTASLVGPESELTPAPEAIPAADATEQSLEPDVQNTEAALSSALATDTVKVGERSFTVQLIGFHTLETLERFAAEQLLPVVYYYRQETYQGRPWFVLIHSLHETREDAEAVVAKLPPALANLNIWIRKLRADTELIEVRRLGS